MKKLKQLWWWLTHSYKAPMAWCFILTIITAAITYESTGDYKHIWNTISIVLFWLTAAQALVFVVIGVINEIKKK